MSGIITLGTTTLASDLRLPPQPRKILAHLEQGKGITPSKALTIYSIYRLSDCIFKIRNAGHDVITENRVDEQGHKYAKYYLARFAPKFQKAA
jgi:helix-turn-helix protein